MTIQIAEDSEIIQIKQDNDLFDNNFFLLIQKALKLIQNLARIRNLRV